MTDLLASRLNPAEALQTISEAPDAAEKTPADLHHAAKRLDLQANLIRSAANEVERRGAKTVGEATKLVAS